MKLPSPSLLRSRLWVLLACTLLLSHAAHAAVDLSRSVLFDIPAQPLGSALLRFSEQAHVQVMAEARLVARHASPALRGPSTPAAALDAMLHGSGLTYAVIGDDAIAIHETADRARAASLTPVATSAVANGAEYGTAAPVSAPASAAGGAPTSAAGTPAGEQTALPDIYVTARRTSERLQDAPLTIRAFSAEQLDAAGIADLYRLRDAAPALTFFQHTDREYGQIFIRGMTSQRNFDTTRELASIFVDGIYYVGTIPGISFSDVERIELVKGPQGALFGRSAFSGALNFITKDPSAEPAADVGARLGTHGEYEGSASVEGPLAGDALRGRLSARYRKFDGDYTNGVDGRRLGAQEDRSAALTLLGTVGDAFTAKLRVMLQKQDDGPSSSQLLALLPEHNCGPFNGTTNRNDTLYCGVVRVPSVLGKTSTTVGAAAAAVGDRFGLDRDFRFGSLSMNYDVGRQWSVASLSGYSEEASTILSDLDASRFDTWINQKNRREYSFTQELRLTSPQTARLRGIVGVFYLRENHFDNNRFFGGSANPFGAGADLGTNNVRRLISNRAVFGTLSYQLTDTLTLSVEGRQQRDSVTSTLDTGSALNAETSTFLPRAVVDWKPAAGLTVYANAGKGTRPTEVNANFAALSPANQAKVGPLYNVQLNAPVEQIWNYEIGLKSEFADGRARVNFAVFHANWSDKQVLVAPIVDLNGNGQIDFTVPATDREFLGLTAVSGGRLRVDGFELEGDWVATPQLTLGASLSLARNRILFERDQLYTRLTGLADAAGQQPALAPRWSGAANATWTQPIGAGRSAFVRVDGTYRSTTYGDLVNLAETGASTKVNLRVGVDLAALRLTVFADNLFNDRHIESIYADGDSASDPIGFAPVAYYASLPRKRQFGMSANYRF